MVLSPCRRLLICHVHARSITDSAAREVVAFADEYFADMPMGAGAHRTNWSSGDDAEGPLVGSRGFDVIDVRSSDLGVQDVIISIVQSRAAPRSRQVARSRGRSSRE